MSVTLLAPVAAANAAEAPNSHASCDALVMQYMAQNGGAGTSQRQFAQAGINGGDMRIGAHIQGTDITDIGDCVGAMY